MKKMLGCLALNLLAGGTVPAAAQHVVSPNANGAVSGGSSFNALIRNAANPRTYQLRVPTSQLSTIPEGALIDAVSFRFDQTATNPASWPPAGGATWANYDITLSEDATIGGVLSTTFANNQLNPVLVRSGPLTIPSGTFTGGSNPNDWGFEIIFDEAYEYAGGPLIITFSHDGSNLAPTAPFLDSIANSGNSLSGTGYQTATGVAANQTIVRLRTADEGTFVAPNDLTHLEASGQANSLLQTSGRTVQVQFSSSQLGGLAVGEIITGIWLRSDDANGPNWPPAGGATFSNYEVILSEAANPTNALSTSFAANMVDPVLVRSGPVTIPAGRFITPPAGQPGNFVELHTKPYVYQGGPLVVTITHTGNDSGVACFVDGENNGTAVSSYVFAGSYQAASGAVNSGSTAPAMRFTTRTAFLPIYTWHNGTVVNRPGQGSGGAGLSLVTSPDSSGGFTASTAGNFRVADELHVLDPFGWNVTRVHLTAYATGDIIGNPPMLNAATVRIWDGVPEAPGSSIVVQSSNILTNIWSNNFRAFESNPLDADRPIRDVIMGMPANTVLPRGTYWIDSVFSTTGAFGPFVPPVQTFRGGKSGDALQRSAPGVWGPAIDSGSDRQMELPFRIIGSIRTCRPDLTHTAIPGAFGYGVSNGILNNDDFFYFLSQFSAGNLAVADLTTGAIPGQPGYGVPNGVINNDDFFYYLSLFATGC